jgi:hypothetical protein
MWEAVERYHGVCYDAPEPRETAAAAGLKGFWMNYFATRVAPLGPVPATVVEATFFYYSPVRIQRAIPDAWSLATPTDIIAARYEGMDCALRRVLGDEVARSSEIAEAAALARRAAEAIEPMGRVLYAGWASLTWPAEPHLQLWHAATLLREARSGAHLIALAAHDLDGCEAVVSQVGVDEAPRDWILDEAKWSEADADAAVARLVDRGWLEPSGQATDVGREGRAAVEDLTDRLDSRHWRLLGGDDSHSLLDHLEHLSGLLPADDQLDWKSIYGANEWTSRR